MKNQHIFFVQSSRGNAYCFMRGRGLMMPVRTELYRMHQLLEQGCDEASVRREMVLKGGLSEADYARYAAYYRWLEAAAEDGVEESYEEELTPAMVENALANTRQITLEVTDACNLRCRYCGYGELYDNYDVRTGKFLSFNKVKALFDFLKQYWNSGRKMSEGEPLYVSFYGGEPLLNMKLIKQTVSYLEGLSLGRPLLYSMTTNALLLRQHIDYLQQHDFHILVSLDGDKQGNSYRVTSEGHDSYEVVYAAMQWIRDKYLDFYAHNINFNAVYHNRNNIRKMLPFFQKEFAKVPRIGPLNTSGIKADKLKEFGQMYADLETDMEKSGKEKRLRGKLGLVSPLVYNLSLFIQQYHATSFQTYNDFFCKSRWIKRLPTGTCIPFSKKIFLTVNGKLLPCERVGQRYGLGVVTDEQVELDIESICKQYNQWFGIMKTQCKHCYNKRVCRQCLFSLQNLSTRPFCLGFVDREAFQAQLEEMVDFWETTPGMYEKIMKNVLIK